MAVSTPGTCAACGVVGLYQAWSSRKGRTHAVPLTSQQPWEVGVRIPIYLYREARALPRPTLAPGLWLGASSPPFPGSPPGVKCVTANTEAVRSRGWPEELSGRTCWPSRARATSSALPPESWSQPVVGTSRPAGILAASVGERCGWPPELGQRTHRRGVLLTASECCLHLLCPQVAESPEAVDTPACLVSPAPPIRSPGLFWLPLRSKMAPETHFPPS